MCGVIQYSFAEFVSPVVLCHCSLCRKTSGSAFGVNASVTGFEVAAGRDAITEYASSPGKWRAFCSVCGSPLYSRLDRLPDRVRVRIGTLETPLAMKPQAHIFAGSKADWEEIADHLPQYEEREPGR